MKKKLLSLVLAGAMVASTSVSAFAATTTPAATTTREETILGSEDGKDINIGITGDVLDNKGNTKPGTINVTVPTAANFIVDKNGELNSGDMVIKNNSNEGLVVIANKFVDSNGDQEISIIKKTDFDGNGGASSKERKKIWLRLKSETKVIGFTSENEGKIYDYKYNGEETTPEMGRIAAQGSMTLKLEGGGGTQPDTSGDTQGATNTSIRDQFSLVLKIKRDRA